VSEQTTDQAALPDLTLSPETLEFLSRILLGGGAQNHAFKNGRSLKISAMLASGVGGFFDKNRYPDIDSLAS
jgi:hypothetical protein